MSQLSEWDCGFFVVFELQNKGREEEATALLSNPIQTTSHSFSAAC